MVRSQHFAQKQPAERLRKLGQREGAGARPCHGNHGDGFMALALPHIGEGERDRFTEDVNWMRRYIQYIAL